MKSNIDAELTIINAYGWTHYVNDINYTEKNENCGKWMFFYEKQEVDTAIKAAKAAITSKTVDLCKHTDPNQDTPTGVLCFYIDGTDDESHKRVLHFMMENNLIPQNLNGNFKNISFKFNSQTQNHEYGKGFKAKINLAKFADVTTGRFYD